MAKLLAVLLLCLAPLVAHATTCAYRTGGAVGLTTGASSATTSTFTDVSGDALVAMLFTTQAQPFASISNLGGSTWTQLPSISPSTFGGGSTYYLYIYTAQNITGYTNDSVTFNISGGIINLTALVVDVSGAATGGSLFNGTAAVFNDGGYEQSHAGGSITTTTNGACLLEFYSDGGSTADETYTAGSGWTAGPSVLGSGSTYAPGFVMYQNDVSAGSYTGPFTTANYIDSGGFIIGIAPAGASGSHAGQFFFAGKRLWQPPVDLASLAH